MMVAAAGVLLGSTTALLAVLLIMGIEAAFFGPLKYAILAAQSGARVPGQGTHPACQPHEGRAGPARHS